MFQQRAVVLRTVALLVIHADQAMHMDPAMGMMHTILVGIRLSVALVHHI